MNATPQLLSRDVFRESVFSRDGHVCVFCGEPAIDAHHILERRLFDTGGYYLDNGASVCAKHHLDCEMTLISVEDVREACGITRIVVPDQLYPDHIYDKWGNHILPNGTRTMGPLYQDESVQKILGRGQVLESFTCYVKYPRTFHLPWSACVHSDDKVTRWLDRFTGQRVIVTEKLDGENTSLYHNYYHARSLDSRTHESRHWAMNRWSQFAHDIPHRWRLCCENLFMEHAIHYDDLESYLYGLSIWDESNTCLGWDETCEWFSIFDLPQPRVLYDGVWNQAHIKTLFNESDDWDQHEGYVVRLADAFHYGQFHTSVAKYVRRNHVQTAKHCLLSHRVTKNGLRHAR